ncbi:ankyrin repeat ph and sec7 domain containing protein secg-related [Anaeramoeba ignava]|uniref:Ankyrin repeat ph and sec7 domain containing protein secg-related n=1 Tax=Anaeramoeba ignava TaxID=1746090 RepID=A0A9Q0LSV2_ANAIG|nr:ankyrin repeat ph and sec7 domain containing protein secg-related [Anaeramoeba ignava]
MDIWNLIENNSIKGVRNYIRSHNVSTLKNSKNQNVLHFAAQNDSRIAIVELFEKYRIPGNKKDVYGKKPIHYACMTETPRIGMIKSLIRQGGNIYAKDNEGKTPLIYLCMKKNFDSELLGILAPTEKLYFVRDSQNRLPLHYICENSGDSDCVVSFLEKTLAFVEDLVDSTGQTPLHFACRNKSKDVRSVIVPLILKKGIDGNSIDKEKRTALHYLCMSKPTKETLTVLINKTKMTLNQKDRLHNHALHYLCSSKSIMPEMIELFLAKNVPVNSLDNQKNNFLHLLCKSNSKKETLVLFVEKGLSFDALNSKKEIPLHLALKSKGSGDLVRYILSLTTMINQTNSEGYTPLMLMCMNNYPKEIVRECLEKGADPNVKSKKNKTPLLILVEQANMDLVSLLFEFGADPAFVDEKNNNVLHHAIQRRLPMDFITCLLEHEVDINQENYNGESPLQMAKKYYKYWNKETVTIFGFHDANFNKVSRKGAYKQFISNLKANLLSITRDFRKLFERQEITDSGFYSNDNFFPVHKLLIQLRILGHVKDLQFFEDDPFLNILRQEISKYPSTKVRLFLMFLYTGFTNPKLSQIDEDAILPIIQPLGLDTSWIRKKKGRKGLLKDLQILYESKETFDFAILAEEKPIMSHRLILFTRSDLFRGMFLSCDDASNSVTDYSGRSYEAVFELIHFFYFDYIDSNCSENVKKELDDAVDFYQLHKNSTLNLAIKNKSRNNDDDDYYY